MKKWMQKIVEQLDLDWNSGENSNSAGRPAQIDFSEEKATLLFLLDVYSKHIIDTESHPSRKTRDTLDQYSKEIINSEGERLEKALFRLRQFFSSYRIEEYTFVQKTFDDFRHIIWDFVDQLAEDVIQSRGEEVQMSSHIKDLRDAVESNSIESLRSQSRTFIDTYIELSTKRQDRREKRMDSIKNNLFAVKKQLQQAETNLKVDHLTKAFNRRSFDERMKQVHNMHALSQSPVSILALDIDFFKKINDNYGHPMGDFVLQECVKLLKEVFPREADMVCRVGGEEFMVILPDYKLDSAIKKAEQVLSRVRKEVFLKDELRLTFTLSIGVAELRDFETISDWIKRADAALYEAKQTGRNKWMTCFELPKATKVA
jgi:diguanylate cyclase (GGDEF)-like protein